MSIDEDTVALPDAAAATNISRVLHQLPAGSLSASLAKAWQGAPVDKRTAALLDAWKTHGLPNQVADDTPSDQ
ncbi:hypothetical protein [Mesorhizobium sp. A556]